MMVNNSWLQKVLVVTLFTSLVGLVSCDDRGSKKSVPDSANGEGRSMAALVAASSTVSKFGSHTDFLAAMKQYAENNHSNDSGLPPMTDAEPASTDSNGPENDSITNNQEAGVDEGGIVKNIGDHLVVLRKGRLYAASVAADAMQTDTIRVAANDGLNDGVWYDELLVSGATIYVIGYRYSVGLPSPVGGWCGWYSGATEINTFTLSSDGTFARGQQLFIESADYFSGDYASRMVDGKLLLYMPKPLFSFCYDKDDDRFDPKIPHYLSYTEGAGFSRGAPILDGSQVFQNVEDLEFPWLHTYLQCGDEAGEALGCRASAFLGEGHMSRYTHEDSTFAMGKAAIYRFQLQSLELSVHASKGYTRDRFAFSIQERALKVLVSLADEEPEAVVDATDISPTVSEPAQPGVGSGFPAPRATPALLTIPLGAFSDSYDQDIDTVLQPIPGQAKARVLINRFVGNSLLYGTNAGADTNAMQVLNLETMSTVSLPLPSGQYPIRLEVLASDRGMLVTNASNWKTGSNSITMIEINTAAPSLEKQVTLEDTRQGEHRSHGFFAKDLGNGTSLIGLAVLGTADGQPWWGQGISNVAFFKAHASGLDAIGSISAGEAESVCETSCIDWYGNTRPIFLKDRVFALMGSELAEGALSTDADAITKKNSINLTVP